MAIHGSQYIIIILTILYKAGAIHRIKWGHVAMKYSDGQTPYPPEKKQTCGHMVILTVVLNSEDELLYLKF